MKEKTEDIVVAIVGIAFYIGGVIGLFSAIYTFINH